MSQSDPNTASTGPSAGPNTPATPDTAELNPRRWAILSVLVVGLLIVVLDNTILNVALPTIQRELGASQEELIWAINSYVCVFAAMLFTWGVLADRWGRKRMLLIGLTIFGLASLLTAYSQTPMQLIVFRGLMGFGGAALLPVTLSIITVIFPPKERGKAIGVWAGAVGGAIALGPILGGFLVEHFWWGSVFLINVPIVVIAVIAIARMVPESKNPLARHLDPIGVLLSIAGLLLLTYGILHGGDTREWTSPSVLVPLLGGIGLLAIFVFVELRSDEPSLDMSLFKIRSFTVPLTAISLVFAGFFGIFVFVTFYLQIVRGWSPLAAGFMALPTAFGQIMAAPSSGRFVERFGARKVMSFGLVVVSMVMTLIALTYDLTTPVWVILVVNFFLGMGFGFVMAPATTRMTLAIPPERSGAGSALQNTVRQVAGSLGLAVISSIVAVAYARALSPGVADLPAEAGASAQESIGHAHAVAEQVALVSPERALQLVSQADAAFLDALHVGAWVGAALGVTALLFVLLRLPAEAHAVAWSVGQGDDAVAPATEPEPELA